MKLKYLLFALLAATMCLVACDDDDTYADRVKRERKQIASFLVNGCTVWDSDSSGYLLNIPGNIKVISESEFYANDSTTDVSKNEYVLFSGSGVYMQIVRKGTGSKLAEGSVTTILNRYVEFNIAGDSVQTSNTSHTVNLDPETMSVSLSSGVFTGSFLSGVMYTTYSSASVPSGWLIPLPFIKPGRHTGDDSTALVRLILPHTQRQSTASYNVYPCFYELTYMRGR